MRSVFARLTLATALFAACGVPNPEGAKKDAPAGVGPTAPKAVAPPPEAAKVPEVKAAGSVGAVDSAGGAEAKAPEGTPAAPEAGGSAGAVVVDPAVAAAEKGKLLGEVKAKKTSDVRAKKALEEAEKSGASVRELAEVANARGEELFDEPERAAVFFAWARDKDPTYAEPVFNLAKQTVNAGEIPATVEHLKEVHKRGGKKLLKQVGFDPTFEIVKDDPEVQKLLK